MSSLRFGKWADADESDEEDAASPEPGQAGAAPMFETKADESGIKLIIDYKEKNGKTYKVTRRIRETKITTWTNEKIQERKAMKKFGKPVINGEESEKIHVVRSEEEIRLELAQKVSANVTVKDEAEDKFYEESIGIAAKMNTTKKSWTEVNRTKQAEREHSGTTAPPEPEKPAEAATGAMASMFASTNAAKDGKPTGYVPPALRGGAGGKDGDGKGKGKGFDPQQQQEQSLRVTNISEDAKEGDLQDLFSSVGRLQRVYLAKDEQGYSRGFAFVTYYTREDALKAIARLNGYGYDNLILQVQFAKPRV